MELIQMMMIVSYFKIVCRQVIKNKVNSAFKLTTLTLALSTFLVVTIYVSFQFSFDRFHKSHENIFRINSIRLENGRQAKYATVPTALGAALKSELPEVKAVAGVSEWGSAMIKYENRLLRIPHMIEADSSLFDVFTFEIVRGTKNALNDPKSIILTESSAKQIFGDQDPINKIISFPDRFDRVLEVKAIIKDLPSNSSLNVDGIMNYNSLRDTDEKQFRSWEIGAGGNNLFVFLAEDTDTESLIGKINPILKDNLVKAEDGSEKHFKIFLQPLSEIYMGEPLKWEFDRKGNATYLYIYLCLAFFLLLVASINYVNLSISDFIFRGKEIGIRKVLGARKKQIAIQLSFETVLYCITALLLSFGLVYLLFPSITDRIDSNLRFEMLFDTRIIALVAFVLLILIVVAATYPVYRLTVNSPNDDLKRKTSTLNGFPISRALLLAQFCISLFCISGTWVVSNQLQYIQSRDVGFDRNQLLTVLMPDRYPVEKAPVLKSEIAKLSGVEAATFSYYHMTGVPYFNAPYQIEINGEMKEIMLNELFVDTSFIEAMKVSLLKGRNFREANEFKTAYLVNETAERELGLKDAIGKRIAVGEKNAIWAEGTIVGVVKDFNTLSLHKKIEPLVLRLQYDSWPGYCLNIRYQGSEKEILSSIENVYHKILPDFLMDYEIVSQRYESQYQSEQKAYTILQWCTWIVVAIACLGVFSISVFLSGKRQKEFGIRKVLGANAHQIMTLHITHFFKTALLANIIVLPFAFWIAKEWLSGFAYKSELGGLDFLSIGCALFLLVLASASYSAWKVGRTNPVDSIKLE